MTPDSTIYCCVNVLLRSDQAHTIYFASADAQRNYFLGKAQQTGGAIFTNYTITRNDIAYVDASLYTAQFWSYAMIEDKIGTGGLFRKFYFIEDATYVDEEVTALHLKLDVMQTFQRQPTNNGYADVLPYCFVEREHSVYDGSKAFNGSSFNTVEEGLDTGEYVVRESTRVFGNWGFCIVAAATIDLSIVTKSSTSVTKKYGQLIDGVYSGLSYFSAPINLSSDVADIITLLSTLGYVDAVEALFLFPRDLISLASGQTQTSDSPFALISANVGADNMITKPTAIGSYTPKNKKLLQYPYCFGYITNVSGLSNTLRFELWNPGYTYGTLGATGSVMVDKGVMCSPWVYKGVSVNNEEGLLFDNFPSLSWVSDTYKLWLAQTSNTRRTNVEIAQSEKDYVYDAAAMEFTQEAIGAAVKLATLNISGAVDAAAAADINAYKSLYRADLTYDNTIKQLQAEKQDHYITPPVSVGNPVGTVAYRNGMCYPLFQIKTIDDMHAKIIDDYFSVYGYQTNAYKVPNISSRPAWNFVKASGFDAKQNIAQKYRVEISKIFQNGVTFWKNGDRIGNYQQNNDPRT